MRKNKRMILFLIIMLMSILMFIIGNILSTFIARAFLFIKYDKWLPYGITDFWDDSFSGMVVGIAVGIALNVGEVISKKFR
ncbi:hypothetical protein PN657_001088 [Cronobacter dublinensis]|nr:hypothetical protein [Cronobacter dublinensis]EKF2291461.1 hypothetical protein [Cronobacter dublinensis]EKF2295476.1 hypothetical protein [Cronobacter dublinensis]EKK5267860.1 hypothetical protein [Cronobacter dublinensis]EKM0136293.1 hypothetical protein [Cronobacter dublinensis]